MKRPLPARPKPTTRAAVTYRRVSTEDQVEGTSLEDQRTQTRRKAEELGYRVVAECADEGISGAHYEARPGLQHALALLECGEAQALVVTKLDRLGRNRLVQELCADRARRAEAKIIYCAFDVNDSPESQLQLGIQGEFAAYERAVFRARSMAGQRKRAESGRLPSGKAPYGYHIVNTKDVLRGVYPEEMRGKPIVVEEEAVVVRRVFEEIGKGHTLCEIATRFKREGVLSRKATEWQRCVISKMLRNTAYIGEMRWGKQQRRTDETRLARGYARTDYQVPAPAENQVVIPCDALVTQEVWDRAQKVMLRNKEIRRGRPDRRYMLTGILRCSKCGRGMQIATALKKGKLGNYYYYACRRYPVAGLTSGERCLKTYWEGKKVEDAILGELAEALDNPGLIRESLARKSPVTNKEDVAKRATEIEKEQAALSRRERVTVAAQLRAMENDLDPSIYDQELLNVGERRRSLAEELTSLRQDQKQEQQQEGHADVIIEALAKIRHQLIAPDVAPLQRREALLTVIEAVVLHPDGRLQIVFRS